MNVSVVVPTRNRPDSLARVLAALGAQTRAPDEVIVVDASDQPAASEVDARIRHDPEGQTATSGTPPVRLLRGPVGVCAQRNLGVDTAVGSWILLCDDDVEPAPDYLERLLSHVEVHPDCGAVTGVIAEQSATRSERAFAVPSLRHLLFAFAFQTSVFGDTEAVVATGALTRPVARTLKAWYRRRGNTWTLAGWPLVTQTGRDEILAATYGLGAALVRREWLVATRFDESLDPHGIGDNYGVALGFPAGARIAILGHVPVPHHRSPEGRQSEAESSYRRALALDYFMRRSDRFGWANTVALAWSLLGQGTLLAMKGRLRRAARAYRALGAVAFRTNPLLRRREESAGPQ